MLEIQNLLMRHHLQKYLQKHFLRFFGLFFLLFLCPFFITLQAQLPNLDSLLKVQDTVSIDSLKVKIYIKFYLKTQFYP